MNSDSKRNCVAMLKKKLSTYLLKSVFELLHKIIDNAEHAFLLGIHIKLKIKMHAYFSA